MKLLDHRRSSARLSSDAGILPKLQVTRNFARPPSNAGILPDLEVLGRARKFRTRFQSLIRLDDYFEEMERYMFCSAAFDVFSSSVVLCASVELRI
ncbi:hypothetical protein MA16_Dca002253 [Dendrobium catenatum]|uniref:Uncharacterized protein n=1 Tax=Dendrobium catenatum TaxID=906689 RepID=A0A2I0VZZ5_9ASPA|nr:hypothetical protein MA16_Dca002253 [Dendrobium catenatum]